MGRGILWVDGGRSQTPGLQTLGFRRRVCQRKVGLQYSKQSWTTGGLFPPVYHGSMSTHPSSSPDDSTPPLAPLTLTAFQKHIRDRYYAADKARGTPATFLWFMEEVGELATAFHGDDRQNLKEEFADVLAWLCTLANINEIDLEAAIREKYLKDDGPKGHK